MPTKLTQRSIEKAACPAGRRDCLVFDSEQKGLGVRIMASGSKSFIAQYTYAGERKRIPLGSTDAVSLAAARDATCVIMGRVALGLNPAADRKAEEANTRASKVRARLTVGVLVGDWERIHMASRSESYRTEAPRTLRKALKAWWDKPAHALKRTDVIALLDGLPPSTARSVAAYGGACYGWAMQREALLDNPFSRVRSLATKERARTLTDSELAKVWNAAAKIPGPYGSIVRLLVLTGQRREEGAGLDWTELSDDLSMWTIPEERAKNKASHVVPLCAAARALLGKPPKERKGLVFPGEGGKRFGNWSKSKLFLDEASGVRGWWLHDIRRTVSTNLQALGVRLEVNEAVTNHVSGRRRGVKKFTSAGSGLPRK